MNRCFKPQTDISLVDCEAECSKRPNCKAIDHGGDQVCQMHLSTFQNIPGWDCFHGVAAPSDPAGAWTTHHVAGYTCLVKAPVTTNLVCPIGSEQRGERNADVSGCGLAGQSCDGRYDAATAMACKQKCISNSECNSFTWAPVGGDQNVPNKNVCTLYKETAPTTTWGPNQVFCVLVAWKLVFRQTFPHMFAEDEWEKNPYDPTSASFSVLNQLESYRQADGKFLLKLKWPGSNFNQEQVWKQTSNPAVTPGLRPGKTIGVAGYEAIHVPYTSNGWGGLQRTVEGVVQNGSPGVLRYPSLLDGSVQRPSPSSVPPFYAVGATFAINGGIPGPSSPVPAVELYAGLTPPETADPGKSCHATATSLIDSRLSSSTPATCQTFTSTLKVVADWNLNSEAWDYHKAGQVGLNGATTFQMQPRLTDSYSCWATCLLMVMRLRKFALPTQRTFYQNVVKANVHQGAPSGEFVAAVAKANTIQVTPIDWPVLAFHAVDGFTKMMNYIDGGNAIACGISADMLLDSRSPPGGHAKAWAGHHMVLVVGYVTKPLGTGLSPRSLLVADPAYGLPMEWTWEQFLHRIRSVAFKV